MSRQLMQKRYIGKSNSEPDTTLSNLTFEELDDTVSFLGENSTAKKAVSIGVQAPEKTIFYINGEKIIMGRTGIFEWDIENIIGQYIESFCFNNTTDAPLDSKATYIADFYLEE